MTTPNNGGPAFPQTIDDMGTMRSVTEGMSLRDWLAGQIVGHQIVAVTIAMTSTAKGGATEATKKIAKTMDTEVMARSAYQLADAMLAARAKETP